MERKKTMAHDEETLESLTIKNELLKDTCEKWSNENNRLRKEIARLEQFLSGGEYKAPPEQHHPADCLCRECEKMVLDKEPVGG
jgi:hypothetical protein